MLIDVLLSGARILGRPRQAVLRACSSIRSARSPLPDLYPNHELQAAGLGSGRGPYGADLEVLLLERASARVTGSRSPARSTGRTSRSKTPRHARSREETGIEAAGGRLARWNVANTFEIYLQWRHRFAPGVTHNTEHVFSLELARPVPVTHRAAGAHRVRLAALARGGAKCFTWSNRDAILMAGAALLAAGCATGGGGKPLAPHLESGTPEVRECARGIRRSMRRSMPRGVRDAQAARVAGFPHCGSTARWLAWPTGRRKAGPRCVLMPSGSSSSISRRACMRSRICRPCRARPRACNRCVACGTARASCGRRIWPAPPGVPRRLQRPRCPTMGRERRAPPKRPGNGARRQCSRRNEIGRASRALCAPGRAAAAAHRGRRPARPRDLRPARAPALSAREIDRLAITYAPTIEIETRADYDRFGWLRWRRGASLPQVDAAEPTVYVQVAYTRYGEHLLLQLVYTLWFPERPSRDTLDPGAGPLDGVVWRVTLAPDGEPLVYDSIHACGCFHAFFPTPRARTQAGAFVPQRLPRVGEDERPVVTLDERGARHRGRAPGARRRQPGALHAAVLRRASLHARLTGGHASAFDPDGRIAGSAARQWGRQAISRWHPFR